MGFPGGASDKEPTCPFRIGDMGLIPELGRGRHGNPFQCSYLENPMERGAWWAIAHGVAKSRT